MGGGGLHINNDPMRLIIAQTAKNSTKHQDAIKREFYLLISSVLTKLCQLLITIMLAIIAIVPHAELSQKFETHDVRIEAMLL